MVLFYKRIIYLRYLNILFMHEIITCHVNQKIKSSLNNIKVVKMNFFYSILYKNCIV
jgi:hypothetical protein